MIRLGYLKLDEVITIKSTTKCVKSDLVSTLSSPRFEEPTRNPEQKMLPPGNQYKSGLRPYVAKNYFETYRNYDQMRPIS